MYGKGWYSCDYFIKTPSVERMDVGGRIGKVACTATIDDAVHEITAQQTPHKQYSGRA